MRAGDILVSTVRPNLNAVALLDESHEGSVASTGFCVLRPDPGVLDADYAFHWVRTAQFVGELMQHATGASYPAVTDKVVRRTAIRLPSIGDQRRIAAVLNAADALRAKRREAVAALGGLTQAIFIDMFGDPMTNSKGWPENRTLAAIADVASGITKGRRAWDEPLIEVPYLAVVNVQDGHIRLDPVKTIDVTAAELDRYALERGDILLTEGGDPDKLGRGAVWGGEIEPCIHQNHIFRVRITDESMSPEYVSRLLGSQRGKRYFLRMAKQTTGIASINMTQLKSFPVLEPPRELQAEFIRRAATVAAAVERSGDSQRALDTLFASLQQRAFRGDL